MKIFIKDAIRFISSTSKNFVTELSKLKNETDKIVFLHQTLGFSDDEKDMVNKLIDIITSSTYNLVYSFIPDKEEEVEIDEEIVKKLTAAQIYIEVYSIIFPKINKDRTILVFHYHINNNISKMIPSMARDIKTKFILVDSSNILLSIDNYLQHLEELYSIEKRELSLSDKLLLEIKKETKEK